MKKLKSVSTLTAILFISSIILSGCATIVGGSSYNAHVVIGNNHPNAQIIYNGGTQGYGTATIKVARKDANKFSFTVRENGYEDQTYNYNKRTFRVGAFIGSLLLWTGITPSGIPLPWGPVIDLASGAIWKPSIYENGVSQESTKNFKYLVNYDAISIIPDSTQLQKTTTTQIMTDVLYLKNGSIIRGSIVELIPNEKVKIKTNDGSVFVYPFSDVEKITKE